MKGLHAELRDDKPMIDRQKVLNLCPSWNKPLDDGIPCIVFRRELEEACPDLPGFLSLAGNQTKLQLMVSLHQLFVTEKKKATSTHSAESAPPAKQKGSPKESKTADANITF